MYSLKIPLESFDERGLRRSLKGVGLQALALSRALWFASSKELRNLAAELRTRSRKFAVNRASWIPFLHMLSILLVPLIVAGMGWYWSRHQQGVEDLKSMIDLITDPSPERQKYGIAMFEFLAKNGRMPIEFIEAQVDYATSAENHELLPMLELALQNAARENPQVANAYRLALERGPARVFAHVPSEQASACLSRLHDSLREADKATILFPAVRISQTYSGSNTEIRFFHAEDGERARKVAKLFGALGLNLKIKDMSSTEWALTTRPNSYELWTNGGALSRACALHANNSG